MDEDDVMDDVDVEEDELEEVEVANSAFELATTNTDTTDHSQAHSHANLHQEKNAWPSSL